MGKFVVAALLLAVLLVIDWLAFHDLFEPHAVRDYLTLAASALVLLYMGLDLRQHGAPRLARSP